MGEPGVILPQSSRRARLSRHPCREAFDFARLSHRRSAAETGNILIDTDERMPRWFH
jgi:hypothetical protein